MLRIENLGNRMQELSNPDFPAGFQPALRTLFELYDLLGNRADIKNELLPKSGLELSEELARLLTLKQWQFVGTVQLNIGEHVSQDAWDRGFAFNKRVITKLSNTFHRTCSYLIAIVKEKGGSLHYHWVLRCKEPLAPKRERIQGGKKIVQILSAINSKDSIENYLSGSRSSFLKPLKEEFGFPKASAKIEFYDKSKGSFERYILKQENDHDYLRDNITLRSCTSLIFPNIIAHNLLS